MDVGIPVGHHFAVVELVESGQSRAKIIVGRADPCHDLVRGRVVERHSQDAVDRRHSDAFGVRVDRG